MSNADDFFSGGNKSASFDQMRVPVGGTILSVGPQRQQRDIDGNPKWWDDARTEPMMQLPIDVQTDLRDPADPADDGVRTLYVKSDMKRAVQEAVKAAGQRGAPKVGGTLHVAWTDSQAATRRGYNDRKIYSARYTPPTQAQDDFFGGQPAPAQAQVSAPAPVQQAQPADIPWGQPPAAQPAMSGASAPSEGGRPW